MVDQFKAAQRRARRTLEEAEAAKKGTMVYSTPRGWTTVTRITPDPNFALVTPGTIGYGKGGMFVWDGTAWLTIDTSAFGKTLGQPEEAPKPEPEVKDPIPSEPKKRTVEAKAVIGSNQFKFTE